MVVFESYIRRRDRFFLVDTFSKKIKDEYIDGGMMLKINNKELINLDFWDEIDTLWAYLINGTRDILIYNKKHFECYFPNQPIHMLYELVQNNILLIKIITDKLTFSEVNIFEYGNAIVKYGRKFFSKMLMIAPINSYSYNSIINEIKQLENKLNEVKK